MKHAVLFIATFGLAFAVTFGLMGAGFYAVACAVAGVPITARDVLFWVLFCTGAGFWAAITQTIHIEIQERRESASKDNAA